MRNVIILSLVGVILVAAGVGVWFYFWSDEMNAVLVPLEEVPEPLVTKAKETLPEVKFDHARRLPNGNYEIRGKGAKGKVREVELKPSGEVVEIE
jgi:hypothetical protein